MTIDAVRNYLKNFNLDSQIREFSQSSATVELAAQALHCEPERIAKTLSFKLPQKVILIVCAGDVKIDNHKYKNFFQAKAKMLSAEEVEKYTGHKIGGVCPFALSEDNEIDVFLDMSLLRFATVFPACGSSNSAIELTPQLLFEISHAQDWIDVCIPY